MSDIITYGTGKLVAIPTFDSAGVAITNPTPVILGEMQDVSVDMSVEIKTLYGGKRFPIAIGQGKGKIEVKAKYAKINGGVLGSLFYGKQSSAGIKAAVFDSAATIPAASTYVLTVAPPNSGAFVADLGVVFSATGVQLTRVASAPATGQYALNATTGAYTFAAADASKAVLISYEYSAATGGEVWTMTNDVMGTTPSFSILLQNTFDGKNLVCKLNRAVSGKLALPFKADDFGVYDFEAQAFANAANEVGYICMF